MNSTIRTGCLVLITGLLCWFTGCSGSGETQTQPQTYHLTECAGKYKTQGRTELTEEGLRCDWSAAGIEFRADCQGTVSLRLKAAAAIDQFYTVIVDDVQQERRHLDTQDSDFVLAEDLGKGVHTFQVYRQDQILPGNLTVMESITLTGELLDPPVRKELLIEFCGDSITAGDGLLGVNGVNTGGTLYTDGTQTYAYLTAQALGADWSLVAQGGATLVKRDDAVAIPEIYQYTSFVRDRSTLWDFERTADIVVVNLGTNDMTANSKAFVEAACDFGRVLQEKNPGAKVVFALGMMTENYRIAEYRKAVKELGGEENGFYFVQLPVNLEGSNSHPNAQGNRDAAEVLTAFLQTILP